MNTHTNKAPENKNQSAVRNDSSKKGNVESSFQFTDNRAESINQRKLNEIANHSLESSQAAQLKAIASNFSGNAIQMAGLEEEELLQGKFEPVQMAAEEEELLQGKFNTVQKQGLEEEELLQGKFETIQKKKNNTGLPDELKSGVENLSGQSLDDVKVHYNSDHPARLNAHAYAQGTDIHVASGQEKHLPHEAWHVVQQKQGRVKPTMQMKGNVNVNDDEGLEKEADLMGAKAVQRKHEKSNSTETVNSFTPEIQLVLIDPNDSGLNASLTKQYHDAENDGDACSVSGKSIDVHEEAIEHYKRAKALRKRAGKLHQDDDGGHLLAIDTLNVKIMKRRELISGLRPKAVSTSPKMKAEEKKGPSNWFGQKPMGTGGQASWLPGNQPAWEPRKFGT